MAAPIGATFVIPLANGQYAAARVLDNEGGVTFVVLDGFWGAVPTADEVASSGLHPLPFGRTDPLLRDNVWKGWFEESLPDSFRIVTRASLTAKERAMGYEGRGDEGLGAAVLEGVVDALNELDGSHGFIESVERDALIQRIEELGSLVGLDNVDEKLTGHRDW